MLCLSPIISYAQENWGGDALIDALGIILVVIITSIIIIFSNVKAQHERVLSNVIGFLLSIMMLILTIKALLNGMRLEIIPIIYLILLFISTIHLGYYTLSNSKKT